MNGGFTSNFAHETMGKYEPFQPWGQGKHGCEPENMVDVAHKNQGFKQQKWGPGRFHQKN